MPRTKLADADVEKRLEGFEGWSRDGDAIRKRWSFEDYAHAVLFTNAVAHLAEQENHHPDVTLGYGYVRVRVTTHDAGGVTAKDFDLAAAVDALPLRSFGEAVT